MGKIAAGYLLLIILLLCSAYSNTFSSPPVLDDFHSFVFEPNVHSGDLTLSSLASLSNTFFGWQRWLPMITFSLDLWFGKGDIFYFHLTNLIIHIFCMLSVLFLVLNILQVNQDNGYPSSVQPIFCAVLVAGLWALNPVQTNAVTYLVQRMASIQSFFFITSVAFYVLGRRKQRRCRQRGKSLPYYLSSLLASIGAFFSKENSAMLPVMLVVTEVWFFTPDLPRSLWNRLKAAPLVVWSLLSIGLLLVAFYGIGIFQDLAAGYAGRDFTMLERLLTQARIVIWYLSLLLWPAPSRLSLEHNVVVSSSLFNPPTTLAAIASLALIVWLIVRFRKRFPLLTYGGIWFLLNLVIESTIVPLELVFEHRLYLPSVGFSLVVVCALVDGLGYLFANRAAKDLAIISSCALALVLSGLTLLTFFRNEAWKDSISIYHDAVQKAPAHPRGHANLAVAYLLGGMYEESMREAKLAIKLGQEKHMEAYVAAANAIVGSLLNLRKFDEAIIEGESLLANLPRHFDAGGLPELYLKVAQAHLKLGQLEQAFSATVEAFQYAQRKRSSMPETRRVEGLLFAIVKGASGKQIDLNQDGVDDPGQLSIKTWIAKELLERGGRGEAQRLLMQASRENPEDVEGVRLLEEINRENELNQAQIAKENTRQTYLAAPVSRFRACMSLAYLGRTPRIPYALRYMGEKLLDYAIEVQPDAADAHLLKAYYLHDRKEIEPAIAETQQALTLDPKYAKAWLALGFFQMELNQFQTAVNAFRRGLELYPGCPQRQSVLAAITAIEQNPALTTAQN